MYDPFNLFGESDLTQPMLSGLARKPLQPYANPAEEDSVLHNLLGKVGGGLSYVGESLGKGGRAVRGVLGGHPEELLNLVPFSDTLGLTNEANRVSGQDLARQWGLADEGTKGQFEMQDLLGPAIEMGLDPLTYATFGGAAIGKAGNIAKKIGVLPSGGAARASGTLEAILGTNPGLRAAAERAAASEGVQLADVLGQPLGGHMGLGVPFMTPSATFDLSGPLGAAGSAAKYAGSWVPFHEQIGNAAQAGWRGAKSLFNKDLQNTTSELMQPIAQAVSQAERSGIASGTEKVLELQRRAEQAGIPSVRAIREMGPTPIAGPASDVMRELSAILDPMVAREQALGGKIAELPNYFPTGREIPYQGLNELARHGGGGAGTDLTSVANAAQKHREAIFEGMPWEAKQQMLRDPNIIGNRQAREGVLGAITSGEPEYIAAKYGLDPENAAKVAEFTAGLAPERAVKNLPFFHPDEWTALLDRVKGHERTVARGEQMIGALGNAAGEIGPSTVPIQQAVDRLLGNPSHEQIGNVLKTLESRYGPDILSKHMPIDFVNELDRSARGLQLGDPIENALKATDYLTNAFKANVTVMHPGHLARTTAGGFLKNLESGLSLPTELAARGMAGTIQQGQIVEGISKLPQFAHLGTTDAEVTAKLAELMRAHGDIGTFLHGGDEMQRATRTLRESVPGEVPWQGYGHHLSEMIPRSLAEANPLNVAGAGGGAVDVFAPAKGGRAITQHSWDKNSMTQFLGAMMEGYTPEEAGKLVKATHGDWGNFSDFEQKVMKRLVPFYGFAKTSIPWEVQRILEKPGTSIGALSAKASDEFKQKEGFLPEYLGGGLSVPLGSEEDGTQRYLSRLGLPFEQAFDWIHSGPHGFSQSLSSLASQLNPLIKFPIEAATGKQLHTNRELGDLYSVIQDKLGLQEKPTMLEQALANSPLSRYETAARTLTDPRKDWLSALLNVGTGARISDVDIAKQRDIAARDAIKEMLQGQPGIGKFETLYPRAGAAISPLEEALMRLDRTIEKRYKERAAEAKKLALIPGG